MLKKLLLFLLVIILVIFVGNVIYNYNTYFFDLYTFKQDHITYLPYTAYKKSIGYTLTDNCVQDNIKILFNDDKIKFIYTEFKKGEVLGNSVEHRSLRKKPKGVIIIYSDVDNKEGMAIIVSQIIWYGEDYDYVKASGEFEVKGEKIVGYLYIRMTPELKNFLVKNLRPKFCTNKTIMFS
ncbi:hypothetical protein [Caloranaerobacter ferrireducens]|uniref:hypothetical protein n=1 Tax=Caloranaerobacter ferrireducens TaxID=1323370 RepID=UPI00084D477D|nr:hypothetical protein [Caloranaerobacter ferrireducens]